MFRPHLFICILHVCLAVYFAIDLQPAYEWSTDLQHWADSGASHLGTVVSFNAVTITDLNAPANDQIRVTATATGLIPGKLFARLRVTQTGQ